MKRIFAISALLTIIVFSFSSCYKNHHCVCNVKTVTQDTKDTVKSTTEHYVLRKPLYEAEAQCKYYETEEDFLERHAIVYHYCEIDDDYKK